MKRTERTHREDCSSARLAQGAIAAVDVCKCGTMSVHVGALTLRLHPSAVSDLLATLGQAVAHYSAQRTAKLGKDAISVLRSQRPELELARNKIVPKLSS